MLESYLNSKNHIKIVLKNKLMNSEDLKSPCRVKNLKINSSSYSIVIGGNYKYRIF